MQSNKLPILFNNDAACDDIIALLYLLAHPNIDLKGITVSGTGETRGYAGAKNLADLCYSFGKGNIPIAYGSQESCEASGKPFPDFLGNSVDNFFVGIDDIATHPNPPLTDNAIGLIKYVLESNNEKSIILATGPLTNVAQFIAQYPELKNKIEKIVMMGGAVEVAGNIQALDKQSTNSVAESNIYADPKAAQIVFSSNIPLTLISLDATNQVPMTKQFYNALSQQTHPALKFIYQLIERKVALQGLDFFLSHYYLWDPLAAMICVNPVT